ncbi:tRNA (adenosine(37)-N6)-threonylcarbamoyltransferase complex transferase subunit TsaD [Candidatus Shapirobacteria bacterium CG_4_10_14_0_2_um_filter_40_12]|uniref:tRNA N6-adenosine threonylcarbamoyltransferase n=1 Tax=Candidatus Shapirobacteria bacterium CG_4_10_14_0_2_um_filter_40_12 TaxID=1974871 RepID=A0A2M7TU30_9BACT|nr:MAG: tRNA (adenosine(37)-N6)-threonylcarbamoyltransferase complex transferase subunit TsaD [Candidatus Shapirobacteria bacterium CG_4_10_14_0_2_um_filter_40_12]
MYILAIETSCDDTCGAVLHNDRILSNIISSQINLHSVYGGVVPDIAKRAHQQRLPAIVTLALKRSGKTLKDINLIAATRGPGLGIALSIGFNFAKDLAKTNHIPFVAVNHVEGHLLSVFLKNKNGLPRFTSSFPILGLTVSGGHTKLVLIKEIGDYQVVGETLDDAAGEALDKSAKLLGLGYPGGPVIERIATAGQTDFLKLPRPLQPRRILNFSFSGLKTSFYYQIKDWSATKIASCLSDLSATFQASVFEHLIRKFSLSIDKYHPASLLASGGVLANLTLRRQLRKFAKTKSLPIFFPPQKKLNTDNAAMIALVAFYRFQKDKSINDSKLDINPRLELFQEIQ